MNRPSRDHWDTSLLLPFVSIASSCPLPLAAFWNKLYTPPFRLEANTMRSPLGDQKGVLLIETSLVKRVSVPRARSRNHRSAPAELLRRNTTDFPSGEMAGLKTGPGSTARLSNTPERSYQAIWFSLPAAPPFAYSRTPLSETVAGA